MKKLLFILLSIISCDIYGQSDIFKVKEGSFHKVEGCITMPARYDDNNAGMAVVKIIPENIDEQDRVRLYFTGNLATFIEVEQNIGETWVYLTAEAATFLKIQHPDFGSTEFWFPMDLKPRQCYEMTLSYMPPMQMRTDHVQQNTYLIIKADQPDAIIYIDDEPINIGEASKLVAVGSAHTYRIECNMYHSESGSVTVNDRMMIEKKLHPNFGYINVSTSPEPGAKVFVDGEYIGVSPIKTDKLKSGSHTVKVMKDMYKMEELSFAVSDGQITNANIAMEANFVNVTINTDAEADIFVDDECKGKGKWSGRLSDGLHVFEARKASHKASVKNVELVLGETKTFTLDAPKPINGSLDVNSTPMGADIYIDGKSYGQTPNYINQILIGTHILKLEKHGRTLITKSITIKENETLSVNEKLQTGEEESKTIDVEQSGGDNNIELTSASNVIITVNGVSFTMIKVEGDTFSMGATPEQGEDAASDEKPVHLVTLDDYYIGETEVTQELWQAVMDDNPSKFKGLQKPVSCVSWNDCQEFITKLNQLTGKNFRLPTEAEWEYAARGGNKSQCYKYSGSNTIGDVAWYKNNSGSTTHDVRTKSPNELGIYDMSGNVWEFCHDWYGDYSGESQTNPVGPSSGSIRVARGGNWGTPHVGTSRVSSRSALNPDFVSGYSGLRIVLSQ